MKKKGCSVIFILRLSADSMWVTRSLIESEGLVSRFLCTIILTIHNRVNITTSLFSKIRFLSYKPLMFKFKLKLENPRLFWHSQHTFWDNLFANCSLLIDLQVHSPLPWHQTQLVYPDESKTHRSYNITIRRSWQCEWSSIASAGLHIRSYSLSCSWTQIQNQLLW